MRLQRLMVLYLVDERYASTRPLHRLASEESHEPLLSVGGSCLVIVQRRFRSNQR